MYKMKKLALLILVASFMMTACNQELITGRGKIVTDTKSLTPFEKVEIIGSCDVELYNGTECYAEISDYENLIPYIELIVEGNTLVIKTKDNVSLIGSKAKVKLFIPNALTALSITGSGDMDINGTFNTLNKITITGSGDIEASVASTTNVTDILITGSGDVDILKIMANTVNCTISGSGDCKVYATQTLNVDISGSGDVYYKGNPAVNSSISGSGEIHHVD